MTISPPGENKGRVVVDNDPVPTSFEKWAQPGHFDRTLARGPKTTTWIWNLHALVHDFDTQTSDLEDISRKVFAAHFGQLAVIFLWLRWDGVSWRSVFKLRSLTDPINIKPSAQVVWPIVGQDILNADVGGGFHEFKSPPACSTFDLLVLQIHSSFIALPLAAWWQQL